MTDLWRLSAAELAAAYRRGDTDPLAVFDAVAARIDAVNPLLNTIIERNPGARDSATRSAQRFAQGAPLGPLDGVPVTIKDSILMAGLPCRWGSRRYADFVPSADELPVARLLAAGAVLLGKTNVPEFTLEGFTTNPLFGTTRNPWNPRLTPGGSSGGAVAAVASGCGPIALGTDGGGSIRRPAAHAGLVGMKPSIGRVARGPSLPATLLDMEVIGPMARTVEDIALAMAVIGRPDLADRRSLIGPDPRAAHRPLRLRYVRRFGDAPVDPAILASTDAAARALAALGVAVDEGPLPVDPAPIIEIWPTLGQAGAAYAASTRPGRDEDLGPTIRAMVEAGRAITATAYATAIERIEAFRRDMTRAFEHIDLVMTPSIAAQPWPADEPYPPMIDGQPVGPRGHAVFTAWVNACGQPALALPSAPAPDGLPIGFQLVGRFGADDLLLDLGRQYEAAQPWRHRWPALGGEATAGASG
jgi:aspartyl-tRNA(Asn)/glutamyl-tRNA(Gln) amidotransferase subunit A